MATAVGGRGCSGFASLRPLDHRHVQADGGVERAFVVAGTTVDDLAVAQDHAAAVGGADRHREVRPVSPARLEQNLVVVRLDDVRPVQPQKTGDLTRIGGSSTSNGATQGNSKSLRRGRRMEVASITNKARPRVRAGDERWDGRATKNPAAVAGFVHGRGWIRTNEGISHQIYSLTRLAASVHARATPDWLVRAEEYCAARAIFQLSARIGSRPGSPRRAGSRW